MALQLRSVGAKFSLAVLLVLVVSTLGIAERLIRHERQGLRSSKEETGRMVTELFAAGASPPLVFEDDEGLQASLRHLKQNPEVIHARLHAKGEKGGLGDVLAGFKSETYEGSPHTAEFHDGIRVAQYSDKMAFSMPVRDGNDIVGHAVVEFSLADENDRLTQTTKSIIWVSIAVAGSLILLLALVSWRTVGAPLGKLLRAASKLGRGEHIEESELPRGKDEVGSLSQGFWDMAKAIRAREAELAQRNQAMRLVLDHVQQGFVTIDREGSLAEERSAIVAEWFPATQQANNFWSMLRGYAPDTFVESHEFGWESLLESVLPLQLHLQQLPKRFVCEEKTFALETTLIPHSEDFEQALMVITDVTSEVDKEKAELNQKELLGAFRQLMKNREAFLTFYEETQRSVATLPSITRDSMLKRELHTLKGNCALYGLASISALCHEVEDAMEQRQGSATSVELQRIIDAWGSLEERLNPLLRVDSSDEIRLNVKEQEQLLAKLQNGETSQALVQIVESWSFPLVQCELKRLTEQALWLAERLEIPEAEVSCEGGMFRIEAEHLKPFWASLSHVIRNAVDHGFESSEERAAAGKDGPPRLTLRAEQKGRGMSLVLEDNGRGINWEKIREVAAERGVPHDTREDLEAALFSDGFSTRKTTTVMSGRGVGMAAVKSAVESLGGRIEIASERGKGTRFRFVVPGPKA